MTMDEAIMARIVRAARAHPDGIPAALAEEISEHMTREGIARREAARGQKVEPPTVPDLFEGITGLPEVERANLDTDVMASAILHHGALLVRGLYSEPQLDRLRRTPEARVEREVDPDAGKMRRFASTSTMLEMLRIYEECGLLEAVRGYFGEQPVIWPMRATLRLRSTRQERGGLAWHQDVNFFGERGYAINCWAAVSQCGVRNPGLEILPKRTDERHGWSASEGTAPLQYGQKLHESTIAELGETHPPVAPRFEPGDALLFDEMTLHRTSRVTCEIDQLVTITWFFRPAGYPAKGTAPLSL